MARFCIVAPPQILVGLHEAGAIGRHHLLLAHDVVRKDRAHIYRMLFDPESDLHLHHEQIILDNGTAETMKPVSMDVMMNAAEIVKPTCIVLPDIYLDGPRTMDSCAEALPKYTEEFGNVLMYIPQGKTEDEFFKAAAYEPLMTAPAITWWGIPRNIVKLHGTRQRAIRFCRALNPYRKIHLFGFSDNLYDDIICANLNEVSSIDSAVPVRQQYSFPGPDPIPPRGDWWEKGRLSELGIKNIHFARQIFGANNI